MTRNLISLALIGMFSMSVYGGSVVHDDQHAEVQEPHSNVMDHGAPWSYSGYEGPRNWAGLSDGYKLCGEGENQSPIDITASAERELDEIKFHYNPSPVRAVNDGHTVQMNYAPGSYMEVGGRKYSLQQLHFHTPSEHAVNGKTAEMELHLVHKSDDGHMAVVGVMMKAGAGNRPLGALWKIMPTKIDHEVYADGRMLNAKDLLPKGHAYYHYRGSLTTPPCSEGVNWFVMRDSVTLSRRAIAKFHSVVGENARPIQELHARIPMRTGN